MNSITLNLYLLFSRFPREIGKYRKIANNWDDFMNYVTKANGKDDVYVYALDFVIDKIFIEIDAPSIEKAFDEAKELVKRLLDYDIPFIPAFSGRRGFHFYILIKPWQPPNIETAKAVLYDFSLQMTDGMKYADHHCFGDVRRLVRVPCTLHPKTNLYCSFLPLDFVNWNVSEIIKWSRELKDIEYNINKLPDIRQLIDVDFTPSTFSSGARPDFDFGKHNIPNDPRPRTRP